MGNLPSRLLAATDWHPARKPQSRSRGPGFEHLLFDRRGNHDVLEMMAEGAEFIRNALLELEKELAAGRRAGFARRREDGMRRPFTSTAR